VVAQAAASPGPGWPQAGLSVSHEKHEVVPEEHMMGDGVMKVQTNLLVESSVLLLPHASAPRYVCAWKALCFLK